MKKALMLRLGALGDVVLATPAARALAAAGYEVHWVTDARLTTLLEGHPHVRRVFGLERKAGLAALWRMARTLRAQRYDLAVDLHNKVRSRVLLALSGASRRAVLRKRRGFELLRALVGLDRPLDRAHAVDLYLEALQRLGVAPSERALLLPARPAPALLEAMNGRLVAIAPGAAHATKRWPAERFAQVGDALAERGAAVLLVGGPGDALVLDEVRRAMRATPLADTMALDPASLAAALARCVLLVSNDTGPVHLAAAHGTPVVALYGPTTPARWGPLGEQHRTIALGLPCSPCTNHGGARCPIGTHACMEQLPVERVIVTAIELLEHGR